MWASPLPVLLVAISVPIAFAAPWLAIVVWLLSMPLRLLTSRFRPEGTGRYLA